MDIVISQIHTLSTKNDTDLKKLRDFLRHELEMMKTNARSIDQALQTLDTTQNTLGIAFLLAAQLSAGVYANRRATFAYIGDFLRGADEQQVKKAAVPFTSVCKSYAQMAIDDGQQAMLMGVVPLRHALEKLRPNAETLTPIHSEFLRVCLKSKAYHLAVPVINQPIFDISFNNNQGNCTQMTSQSFLCYFYYAALIRVGMKEYAKAMHHLLVVLTCPASCLSAIQADAYKKYVLLSLKVHGELQSLPVYAAGIVQRFAKLPGYALDVAEAFKQGDSAALRRVAEERSAQIQVDNNTGLVKQVIDSLQRHKVQTLTKTYLTLSLAEIAREVGLEEEGGQAKTAEVEELLFDMISSGEINARIDLATGNVSFEEDEDQGDMDALMVEQLQEKLGQVLELAQRVAAFEREVVSSEAYVRKTAALEGERSGSAAPGYDFMAM